jgi:hypothetical protein
MPTETIASPLLVDLGKQSRKQVKRLRNGTGPLVDEINRCMHDLKASGAMEDGPRPVVVVIAQKSRRVWV